MRVVLLSNVTAIWRVKNKVPAFKIGGSRGGLTPELLTAVSLRF